MGRGSSKIGGGGGSFAPPGGKSGGGQMLTQDEMKVNELAVALNNPVSDPNEPTMSSSDVQSAVEAYAMLHPGVDEDAMLNAIRDRANNVGATSNWRTWQPGNSVSYTTDDAGLNRSSTEKGVVTEIFSDHAIVKTATFDHLWVDADTAYQFKLR